MYLERWIRLSEVAITFILVFGTNKREYNFHQKNILGLEAQALYKKARENQIFLPFFIA